MKTLYYKCDTLASGICYWNLYDFDGQFYASACMEDGKCFIIIASDYTIFGNDFFNDINDAKRQINNFFEQSGYKILSEDLEIYL